MGITMKKISSLVLLIGVLLLSSCTKWWAKDDDSISPYQGIPAKDLYQQASTELNNGQYNSAAKKLEAMDNLYPFSEYAESAQLKLIYAYYQDQDYPSSAATAERFIHLYPRSQTVDYAYYMKGLANFQQPRGSFAKFIPLDESWRDPGTQAQAYSDFGTLIQRFPQSKYKANALSRMIYLRNMLAQRELNNARYYYKRGMYVAAAGRASTLVKNYPQAPSVADALVLLRDANLKMDLKNAALDAEKVYAATYNRQMPVNG